MDVLEIGCGRGGGLNYVSQYLEPKSLIGIDFSGEQAKFCSNNYSSNEKMNFYQGDAETFATEVKEVRTK
jgi:cyclopropane fatty-acyl-phospholipid synthase-like methyltransferase